ncbi:MAG TPA: FAD-dependent oxidoreductase, partial [Dermatophilaceae bacterium]|nr:FAD-dependent oxidoreductase [Dermatophilaceae bacterium]
MTARSTSVVVVGAGPGGYEAALVARQLGADVTIIDSDGVGGAAVLTDCVPSKTLISTSTMMTALDRARSLGVHVRAADGVTELSVVAQADLGQVNDRVIGLAQAQSDDIAARLVGEGVRMVRGRGR